MMMVAPDVGNVGHFDVSTGHFVDHGKVQQKL
jgi:hypothetical protein